MAGIWMIARLDVRHRWRSLVAIALLIALGSASVMALLAGARRGITAADRLEAATSAATVYVNPASTAYRPQDWAPIAALPYVAGVAPTVVFSGLDIADPRVPNGPTTYPPLDARYGTEVDRPVVISGRMYDPTAVNEAIVTPQMADTYGYGVGSDVRARLSTPQQATTDAIAIDELLGPWVTLHVVGVVRSTTMLDSHDHPARIGVTPAFTHRYWANIHGPGGQYVDSDIATLVRLRGGMADVGRLQADVTRIFHGHADVITRSGNDQLGRAPARFESRVLLAMAAAALLATLVLVGQAIRRHVADGAPELRTLGVLGAERRTTMTAATVPILAAGAIGAIGGAAGALLASRWFPIGAASRAEPAPGVRLDGWVLSTGAVATVALSLIIGLVGAFAATRPPRHVTRRRGGVARVAAILPLPIGLGLRFALEPDRGHTRNPVATTLVAAGAGVAGVVTAIVFSAGLNHAIDDATLLGQSFTAFTVTGMQGQDFIAPPVVEKTLAALPSVASVHESRASQAHTLDNRGQLWVKEADQVAPVLQTGRLPMAADEIVLAPQSAADLHVAVGDRLPLQGDRGTATYTVVGEAYLYTGYLERYQYGAWLDTAGFNRIFKVLGMRYWYLDGRGSATDVTIRNDLKAAHPDWIAQGMGLQPPDIAQARGNMADVRALPEFLGTFLALLGLGAAAHALALSVRRRRRDLAIARTLGMTPGQSATALLAQSMVSAMVGVAVGLPLGLAAGRTSWRWMAGQVPAQFLAPGPWGALAIVALAALAAALLIALLPARLVSRGGVADALRAE